MEQFKALENERWVWAKLFDDDYSDDYLVSDLGRCWSNKTKKFVGKWVTNHKNKYFMITLSKNGEKKLAMIGRLMLSSFNIPIPSHLKDLPTSKLQAMHLDGNSKNNKLSNFAWGDSKDNQNEENAVRKNRESNKGKTGKDNPNSKPIIQYSKAGELIRIWNCIRDVEIELGIANSNICNCARGKLGSCGGYIWKYKE